jgi:hypothetical protein
MKTVATCVLFIHDLRHRIASGAFGDMWRDVNVFCANGFRLGRSDWSERCRPLGRTRPNGHDLAANNVAIVFVDFANLSVDRQ